MAVTGIHIYTTGQTQYDLRQAVMWAQESPTVVLVNYRGAPEETWVRHDLAGWAAAKQTSLGSAFSLCPHIFNIAGSYWDVRFAAMWVPVAPNRIKVYYEAANEFTWVEHPSQTAWEAVKQNSLNNGG